VLVFPMAGGRWGVGDVLLRYGSATGER
jgi:hypothetical protein